MGTTANELLALGATELPAKEITLKCGKVVKIQALDGVVRMDNIAKPLSEQVKASLEHGLVEPKLSPAQCEDFAKRNYALAGEIFSAIVRLNEELDDVTSKARAEAEKN